MDNDTSDSDSDEMENDTSDSDSDEIRMNISNIVEALLNGDIDNFPKYVYRDDFDIEILGLEGKIIHGVWSGRTFIYGDEINEWQKLFNEWQKLPGDLRLFNLCVKRGYGRLFYDINFIELLECKSYDNLSINVFKIICDSKDYDAPDFNNKLMNIYEKFSETGILHRMFLDKGKFHEYMNLSIKYKFDITNEHWNNNNLLSRYDETYLSKSIINIFMLDCNNVKININILRQMGIFPSRFHIVYDSLVEFNKQILVKFIICYFNQLTLEEKNIWLNIIKSIKFHIGYYIFIKDKDTLDVVIPPIHDLINQEDIDEHLRRFSINCSIVMLDYFINNLPENLITRIKLHLIVNYDEEKIKYFFGEVTQDDIDNLVNKLNHS